MATHTSTNFLTFTSPTHPKTNITTKSTHNPFLKTTLLQKTTIFLSFKSHKTLQLWATNAKEINKTKTEEDKPQKFKWVEVGPNITETHKQAISELPLKMTNRCKALMRQIICFSTQKGRLEDLLSDWVRIMKPRRTDWLSVLKQLKIMDHPLYVEVARLALLEESFETNVRDYTKVIHYYGKQNRLQVAEDTLLAMKRRGFVYDQVILTTMIHLYSKAGYLKRAEETFEELKLLGEPLDKRSYGSMVMAYIRAGMPDKGEILLREMDAQDITAGSEVYKALLRAYSMVGDTEGSQRAFDAIQLAGIPPDAKVCGLLINAYQIGGESQKAYVAFENMRAAGLEPNDKCVALVLAAYEMEDKLSNAMDFLIGLERHGIMIGKEASEVLARWFRRLGVVKEMELVLREYTSSEIKSKFTVS